jgi:hypothetical protein
MSAVSSCNGPGILPSGQTATPTAKPSKCVRRYHRRTLCIVCHPSPAGSPRPPCLRRGPPDPLAPRASAAARRFPAPPVPPPRPAGSPRPPCLRRGPPVPLAPRASAAARPFGRCGAVFVGQCGLAQTDVAGTRWVPEDDAPLASPDGLAAGRSHASVADRLRRITSSPRGCSTRRWSLQTSWSAGLSSPHGWWAPVLTDCSPRRSCRRLFPL